MLAFPRPEGRGFYRRAAAQRLGPLLGFGSGVFGDGGFAGGEGLSLGVVAEAGADVEFAVVDGAGFDVGAGVPVLCSTPAGKSGPGSMLHPSEPTPGSLGAPVRSCECASRGGRIAQDRTRMALRADSFLHD